uniref:Uncharacterized protein n=1 Tax=Trichuris muris TaxID=70415 RepID=A0A5S6Q8E1_TRIMR
MSPEEMQQTYDFSVKAWGSFNAGEPYNYQECQLERFDKGAFKSKIEYDLHSAIKRQRDFNYQVSLPHFTSKKYLAEAVNRYKKFVFLKIYYKNEFITPCYDFDIVWHAHQVHIKLYIEDTLRLIGRIFKHDDSVNDRSANSKLLQGESLTKKLWQHHFPGEPYWRRGAMYRGHSAPCYIGLQRSCSKEFKTGSINVTSFVLKNIPPEREYVKLKLTYGGKRVAELRAEIEAELSSKVVRKNKGFILIRNEEQPDEDANAMSFDFDVSCPKELVATLELYDRAFLQKKDVMKMEGVLQLDQLLSAVQWRSAKGRCCIILSSTGSKSGKLTANMNLSIELITSSHLEILPDDFSQHTLQPQSALSKFCRDFALNKLGWDSSRRAWIATHTLHDTKSGQDYTVQVIHSAPALLSAVLVFDHMHRLTAAAHLAGPDSLPSRSHLEEELTYFPNLSSPEERAVIVLSTDGDFAVFKGSWVGHQNKVVKSRTGNPSVLPAAGRLVVEAINLSSNTFQKFELPSAKGLKMSLFGEAKAALNGKTVKCTSVRVSEYVCSVFATALLFVLCNPDNVHAKQSNRAFGHRCYQWPLVMAAGYSTESPSNRYLLANFASKQTSNQVDPDMENLHWYASMVFLMSQSSCALADGSSIGACGSCGACGACGACGSCGGCGGCGGM